MHRTHIYLLVECPAVFNSSIIRYKEISNLVNRCVHAGTKSSLNTIKKMIYMVYSPNSLYIVCMLQIEGYTVCMLDTTGFQSRGQYYKVTCVHST